MPSVLITGSAGLIGSEVSVFFGLRGFEVHGVDSNQRRNFFGPEGDTAWSRDRVARSIPKYVHYDVDIRNREGILEVVDRVRPGCIIHTAAQPSHDLAARIPFDDFDTNAVGTLNLLEAARRSCPEVPFIHMSTNKVYGDGPNTIALKELENAMGIRRPGVRTRDTESFRSTSPSTRFSAPPRWLRT